MSITMQAFHRFDQYHDASASIRTVIKLTILNRPPAPYSRREYEVKTFASTGDRKGSSLQARAMFAGANTFLPQVTDGSIAAPPQTKIDCYWFKSYLIKTSTAQRLLQGLVLRPTGKA